MAYEVVSTAPKTADFTPLTEHQEQTPGSFFAGRPVLHLHCPSATVKSSKRDLASQSDFAALYEGDVSNIADQDAEVSISNVDVWVTSRYIPFRQCCSQAHFC